MNGHGQRYGYIDLSLQDIILLFFISQLISIVHLYYISLPLPSDGVHLG